MAIDMGTIMVDAATGKTGRVGERIYPSANPRYRRYSFQHRPGHSCLVPETRLRTAMPGEERAFRRAVSNLPPHTWGIFCIPIARLPGYEP